MKFIKPSEISSKIMTLIDESNEFVLLVSPYIRISKWYKLLKRFETLKERNIPVEFVIRDDETNQQSFDELKALGFNYSAIKDLHCKLYLNEKKAIVSSMNLLLSSEINSIEVAYSTETEEEYQEIVDFCKRYLKVDFDRQPQNIQVFENTLDWRDTLCNILTEQLGRSIKAVQLESELQINTGINNYSGYISKGKQNRLCITGIVSGKEFDYLCADRRNIPQIEGVNIELQKGSKGYYDMILGTIKNPIVSQDLNSLNHKEKDIVVSSMAGFIIEIDSMKKWIGQNIN